ncbi:MAG: 50S ribosomal protein L25 [Bryobacterales bacterium]|nr:50S ribosomal protein L25 [Bryobacterales bacterium]
MRKDITVAAEARETRGKNAARRLRMAGKIPAVVYGAGGDSVPVTVSPKEITKILHSSTGHNTIFDLQLNGGATPVMVIDWLHDPIKSNLLHVDLKRIDLTKKLRVRIPVHFQGDPVGVKIQGGIFEVISRELEVECLPDAIPEFLTSDVSQMNIGESIRGKDVALPEGVALGGHGDLVLAHVITTRGSDTATADAEGAAAAGDAKSEPEVIKKGKKEEEAAAEEKKKK